MRFVGLGDSLTQGVGDPRQGRAGFAGELDGWVVYFAEAVRAAGLPLDVENYAVAGARIDHVIDQQLPQALAKPLDIVSCFVGVNDLWDINLDVEVFGQRFNALCIELAVASPVVIAATIHDVCAPYPLRASLRQKLALNISLMNEQIRDVVSEQRLVLIDFANRSEMFTRSVLAVDLLHPNRYGHQLIAKEVIEVLHDRNLMKKVLPPEPIRQRRGAGDVAHVVWVGGYVKDNWSRWRSELGASRAVDHREIAYGEE
jgi:lysophospholipase L1-like esterase